MKAPAEKLLSPDFWFLFWRHFTENALRSLIQIGAILLAYLILSVVVNRLIDGVVAEIISHERRRGLSEERSGRLNTVRSLCKSTIAYVLMFVFGITLLKAVGFDIMPFITTAGVIGIAVGFASQKLVKDVISGFFIIVDDLFVVGETVTIGTTTGRVHEMGMRVTRLIDATGKLVILSNGDIGTIVNLSRNPVEEYLEIAVAAAGDLNRAVEIINEACAAVYEQKDHRLKAPSKVLGITAVNAASVTIRISIVCDPFDLPAEQMRLRSAIRDALSRAELALA
jgi:small conductance mechanosensitive channel